MTAVTYIFVVKYHLANALLQGFLGVGWSGSIHKQIISCFTEWGLIYLKFYYTYILPKIQVLRILSLLEISYIFDIYILI